ncbi:ABC transporter permease [Hoeflea sp. TYP-13]|uniref:ABC transporter permease n=1 Tax=Hoeflea sp. TYP-13 TaxID=3230023 RepID=UPI0034C66607
MTVIETRDESLPRAEHPAAEAWRIFRSRPAALFGLLLLGIIVLISLLGPYIYAVDPFEIVWAPLTPPFETETAILGTDNLGRDMLAGLIVGGRATLLVGITAALITIIIGILVGALAGYYLGWVDDVFMRITEFFQVLPPLLFAMVLVTLFTPSLPVVAISIGVVSWPATARLARAEFMRIRGLEYVSAGRSIGARDGRLIWRVILPNALAPLIVSATLTIGVAILFEAGLSFLGLSDPNTMSWGLMIGSGRQYILDAWWVVTLPGAMIFLTVLGVSLIGDGLNDAFNPKLRER